ncbi:MULTISPECIES: Bug family tripartite tricarboxylate transporter substrate binding protein [Achromobacter]|jgi:tripartite-type tricarboxylate transporter receptor subunit TctC|uniref:Bug family tripartite tricarboxylate transporter substrate binding protein n=1 Tax=Achromobacter TaxID=222 RepID=UPI0001F43402|nr:MULTISPECIES: tripartite tricarboxylate transporter substrate binding protein [Achromobacter]EFV83128.1 TctC protein [Achromobacter xylosoxidans C54]KOQ29414.1 ABC transporter substrate-binding protein [Achromobacter xylosoxidans]KOQ31662.1 ABC transporter substrate-binding protein [Achromobacter xylosoxidans]KOQ35710.1 ABC transporter substrate-binding protein [Achromobacter xylosoxidans]KOQ42831.1 ABC transporter substrate-binding protein [Achromobacter xylosoxidans]
MSSCRPWRRRVLQALCLTLAGAALPFTVQAQANYPDRPLRIIVPFTAGGSSDIQGRLLAEHLGKLYGQSVVVENRPGAGGHIGGKYVADSGPDGYTLLLGSIGLHATYGVYKTLNYRPADDLKLITIVAEMPHVVVANPALEATTLAELTAQAKAKPETLHFGSAGVGSSVHMVGELYKTASQAPIVHIPYRGSSAALNDLLGGQIQLLFENVPTTIGYIQSGKLKALAITGATRSAALPDVPTAAEAGLPGLTVTSWTTLAAGKDVPDALIEKISADLRRVYADPAFRAGLERLGMTPVGNTPAEARAFVERERARWNKVIEAEHISAG